MAPLIKSLLNWQKLKLTLHRRKNDEEMDTEKSSVTSQQKLRP